ncbi:MAG: hypothetical protein HRT61_15965 [Ekhidna sp.]|nr:hypothetical protein [Ekhidna sp.]
MKVSRWLIYDDNLDNYSIIEVSKLLKTFLVVIPFVSVILSAVNFALGFKDVALTILTVPGFCLFSFLALRKEMMNLSIIILITILIAANTLACVLGNGVHETGIIMFPAIVLFSSLVLNVRGVVVTTIIVLIGLAYIVFGEKYGLYPSREVPPVKLINLIVVEMIVIMHIFVTYSFSNITKKNLSRVKIELQNQEKYKEEIENNLVEKSELPRQVHHRVKNNLLLINSLIDLESYGNPSAKKGLSQITNSINTIARAHDPLYHSEDYKQVEVEPYLETLLSSTAQNTKIDDIQYEIQNHLLFHQKALLLGVIIQRISRKMSDNEVKSLKIKLVMEDILLKLKIESENPHGISRTDLGLEEKLLKRVQGKTSISERDITVTIASEN